MGGYYKDPERTRAAFTSDGWLRTGDIGYRDDDGFFYVIGRAKEIIIKGGENIAPREIDEAVVKHPCVLDAAAVGIPHPRSEEHTSELQSLMRISYAVFCLKKKKQHNTQQTHANNT